MSSFLQKLGPVAKAITAAVIGAVIPLLTVSLAHGLDYKAIVGAALTSALSALLVYLVPNRPKAPVVAPVPPAPAPKP